MANTCSDAGQSRVSRAREGLGEKGQAVQYAHRTSLACVAKLSPWWGNQINGSSVERLVSSACLARCYQVHLAHGGSFSNNLTQEEAVSMRANMRSKQRKVGKPRGSYGYFLFQADERHTVREQHGEPVGKEASTQDQLTIATRWRNLSDAWRQAFEAEAELKRQERER